MSNIPHDLPYDNRLARMRKRLQGLQRVAAAINDLYIYGVYPSNFPNLTLREDKDGRVFVQLFIYALRHKNSNNSKDTIDKNSNISDQVKSEIDKVKSEIDSVTGSVKRDL